MKMAKKRIDSVWAFIAITDSDTLTGELIQVRIGSDMAAQDHAQHLSRQQGRSVHWFKLVGVASYVQEVTGNGN